MSSALRRPIECIHALYPRTIRFEKLVISSSYSHSPGLVEHRKKMGYFIMFDILVSLFFACGLFSALLIDYGPTMVTVKDKNGKEREYETGSIRWIVRGGEDRKLFPRGGQNSSKVHVEDVGSS